jgi:hypothetical protein
VKQGLIKRAPLVLILLGVLFAWQGGFGLWPVERTITWKLWGEYGTIRRVECQLYDGDVMLQRADLTFPNGATSEPTSKISLKAGHYPTKVMVWRAGAQVPEVHSGVLELDATTPAVVLP